MEQFFNELVANLEHKNKDSLYHEFVKKFIWSIIELPQESERFADIIRNKKSFDLSKLYSITSKQHSIIEGLNNRISENDGNLFFSKQE